MAIFIGIFLPLSADAWTFISSPDWFNRDVADLSGNTPGIPQAAGWDNNVAKGLNGVSPQMMLVYDYILGEMTAYNPEFYTVAGDLVNGRWSNDLTLDMFDPHTRTRDTAISNAAGIYYPWYRLLLQRHGISTIIGAVGDHELGDDDWPAGSEKALHLDAMRRAFARNMVDPLVLPAQINGVDARPYGTPFEGSSYAYQHNNLLVVTVDVFQQDDPHTNIHALFGTVSTEVSGAHLTWLAILLGAADQDPSIDHVIVQGHVPVLGPVRMQTSSGMMMVDRQDSDFWQLLREHTQGHGGKLRLYLCGEVHTVTASKDPDTDLIQLVHGNPPWGAGVSNVLVFNILPERIEIESREFDLFEDGTSLYWQVDEPISSGPSAVMSSREAGTLTLDTSGPVTSYATTGDLDLMDQTGLTVHFGFDQTTPSGLFSNTGSIGDHYYEGVSTGGLGTQPGIFGTALRLNGTDAYMESGRGNMTEGESRTASAWFLSSNSVATQAVLSYGKDWTGHAEVNGRFELQIARGNLQLNIGSSINCVPEKNASLADGSWHHVAVVLPGRHVNRCADVLFYVDGEEFSAGSLNASASLTTVAWTNIRIGAGISGKVVGNFFNGAIDEAAIWGSALPRARVRALATAGRAPALRYDAAAMESLFDLFDARQGRVSIGDLSWAYVTGLTGAGGDVLDLGEQTAIQLDDSGNGVATLGDPGQPLVGDNGGVGTSSTGTWDVSDGANPYGADSLFASSADASYTYRFALPAPGEYQVFAWWTVTSNRRSSVPYDITHVGGTDTVTVNQQVNGGQWNQLGTRWTFDAIATITVRSLGNGTTSADAIMLVPAGAGDNTAPVLSPIGARSVTAGTTLSLTVSASDADGATPVLGVAGLPAGAAFGDRGDGTGTFRWPTTTSDLGTYKVTFTATDADDAALTDSETVTIAVSGGGLAESARLIPHDGAPEQRFGRAVAVSGDTALIGRTDVSGSGAAYVFVRDQNGAWVEQAELVPASGAADFGVAVGVSGDTAVVGASEDSCRLGGNGRCGSAYVFSRDHAGTWTEQATLWAGDGMDGDRFGGSVAMGGDRIIVGAANADGDDVRTGAAYVFARNDQGMWTETARLVTGDGAPQAGFGVSVALSGETAVVGANRANAAYVFHETPGGSWVQSAKLVEDDAAGNTDFGCAVALADDVIVVGARLDDTYGEDSGAAQVFTRVDEATWNRTVKLTATDADGAAEFGSAVAVSDRTVVIGAYLGDGHAAASGAAYLFGRGADGLWFEMARLQAGDGMPGDQFGHAEAVAVSSDEVLIGAPGNESTGPQSGVVYAFDITQTGIPLLLRRTDNGKWYTYELSGTEVWREGFIGLRQSADYQPVSRQDFNGDRHPDVLLRDVTGTQGGQWQLYLLDGLSVLDYGYVSLPVAAEWVLRDTGDFDGDGKADVLLRHTVTGEWRLYLMDGYTITAEGNLSVSTSLVDQWIGSADFNGDGRKDLLLRATDGSWRAYLIDGLAAEPAGAPEAVVFETLNATCTAQATFEYRLNDVPLAVTQSESSFSCGCDAPVDTVRITDAALLASAWSTQQGNKLRFMKSGGDADVAWVRARLDFHNATDSVCLFDEAGGNCNQPNLCTAGSTLADLDIDAGIFKAPMNAAVPLKLDPDWRVDALADFNGDARADILIKRPGGRWFVYLMNGTEVLAEGSPILSKNPDLHFMASGDFSGDGKADLLLRHDDGHWDLHALDGLTVIDSGSPALNKNTAFAIIEIADFNLDGKSDVLLKRPDGPWIIYLMDGPRVMRKGWPKMAKGTVWQPIVD